MPKRKAATRISGLLDSDDEIVDNAVASHSESHDERPAKKPRGRPKSTGVKVEERAASSKPARTSSAAAVKQNGTTKRVSNRGRRPRATTGKSDTIDEETEDGLHTDNDLQQESAQEEEVAPAELSPVKKRRGRPRDSDSTAKQTRVTEDGEFEYTPTGSRQFKPTEEAVIPDSQNPTSDAFVGDAHPSDKRSSISSPLKSLTNGERPGRKRPTVTFADTVEKASSSDPDLRRMLGDMTKKYETLEVKYRNLREIGVVEANANFEKIRKQCDSAMNGKIFNVQHM